VNNLEMAVSYERQAAERLRHAREALASGISSAREGF
jgi:hypothetical protein